MLNFRTYYQRVGVLDVDVDQSVNTIERAEVLCRRGLTARRVCRPDGKRTLPTAPATIRNGLPFSIVVRRKLLSQKDLLVEWGRLDLFSF